MPTELKLCQPEEIVIIQVGGERVFSENRLERKIQSAQRKQEVKGVRRKKVRKDAEISGIRQEEREREQREGISKKASF